MWTQDNIKILFQIGHDLLIPLKSMVMQLLMVKKSKINTDFYKWLDTARCRGMLDGL